MTTSSWCTMLPLFPAGDSDPSIGSDAFEILGEDSTLALENLSGEDELGGDGDADSFDAVNGR